MNVDILKRELSHHPDPISPLQDGTHISYTGPQKTLVSRNLISAIHHPEVVLSNLTKEIRLDRVTGPFDSSPLPNLQCHPVGVVPKKHSLEWLSIYHLSHPQ